jgi:hypothetical protein
MSTPRKMHPHDVGLPEPIVRKRRHSRRVARIMLTIAAVTALAGWTIFGGSIFSAIRIRNQSPYQAIIAYVILIVSSATFILGLWYLLLAQVDRVARMVESDDSDDVSSPHLCPNCGWGFDGPDRFCRHCGKPLGASISASAGAAVEGQATR